MRIISQTAELNFEKNPMAKVVYWSSIATVVTKVVASYNIGMPCII